MTFTTKEGIRQRERISLLTEAVKQLAEALNITKHWIDTYDNHGGPADKRVANAALALPIVQEVLKEKG